MAAGIALILKLVIAFNTLGTNDVVRFYQFAGTLTLAGLEQFSSKMSSVTEASGAFGGSPTGALGPLLP